MDFTKLINFPTKEEDTSDIENLLNNVAADSDMPCWDDKLEAMIRQTMAGVNTGKMFELSDDDLELVQAAAKPMTADDLLNSLDHDD